MKFIDITDDYIVNVDAIFSLERREINSSDAQEDYENAVNTLSDYVSQNPPELDCDGVMYKPTPETMNEEIFSVYKEKFVKYLENEIQNYANNMKYEYYAILSTGIKVQLSYSKYQAILERIRN